MFSSMNRVSRFRHALSSSSITTWRSATYSSIENTVYDGLVKTHVEDKNKVANLILNRPPVNSLSMEMCQAISKAVKSIEKDHPHVQSLVLSSSNPNIFSAGLDLTEMYQPSPERLSNFWKSVQQVYIDLYGSRLAIIGAIEGHAPGGGCLLAMTCDYRIMASCATGLKSQTATIGLNEAQFGLVAPPFLGQLLIRTIGFRPGEQALQKGTLWNAKEALKVGLVDDIVPVHEVLSKADEIAAVWSKIPGQARYASKMLAREEHITALDVNRQEDTDNFCRLVQSDKVQAGLGAYIASLKKK